MSSAASSGLRVIVIAVDASDNAKDAFDCTYYNRPITAAYIIGYIGLIIIIRGGEISPPNPDLNPNRSSCHYYYYYYYYYYSH